MKLSKLLGSGRIVCKEIRLLIDIDLDDDESRKKGDIVSLIIEKNDGTFHAEDNGWACELKSEEFEYVKEEE